MPAKARRRNRRLQTGIRRRPNGTIEAYVQVGDRKRSKTFPAGTATTAIQRWRFDEKAKLGSEPGGPGTIGADLRRYLTRIRAQRSYETSRYMLERWRDRLGAARRRDEVTTEEIEAIIQEMTLERNLSAETVRRYCSTLQRMWTVLDGRGAPNPVRAAEKPPREPLQTRALPPEEIERLLDAMPDTDERTVCRLIAWTGLTHEQIRQLQPEDIYWERGGIQTRGRRKGGGSEARFLRLMDRGLEALREFDERKLYGKVNNHRVWVQVKRAGKAIGRSRVRPYDLRHSFATLIYEASGDLDGTAFLLNHSSTATTKRYALGAFESVAARAVQQAEAKLSERLGRRPTNGPDRIRRAR